MFDLEALSAAIDLQGLVARVVIASVEGSSPRELGASMLVWEGGQSGTIGGGALEHAALGRARQWLADVRSGPKRRDTSYRAILPLEAESLPPPPVGEGWGGRAKIDHVALGPTLGQCCGGAVTLWTELFDAVPKDVAGVIARGPGAMPLAVRRLLAAARGQGVRPATGLVAGWLVEPVAEASRHIWVWGAGHVGRALVTVLAPLPGVAVTWVDISPARFPDWVAERVRVLPVPRPEIAVALAPVEAEHIVLTYSHALDLELCHQILTRGFRTCGLIGSATKWARFRSRLLALGHPAEGIDRIDCPIGDPAFGKHPQAIAIGVAARMLRPVQVVRKRERA